MGMAEAMVIRTSVTATILPNEVASERRGNAKAEAVFRMRTALPR
jgi:hypothetical protein